MVKKKIKIVVASGKGGVGKSLLASSLAILYSRKKKIVAVDADVDAPNLHLWLGEGEDWDSVKKVSTNERPIIDLKKCTGCGQCEAICAFKALAMKNQKPVLNQFFCEGCGACEAVCPVRAIKMEKIFNAELKIKKEIQGFPLISGQLYPGQTGSGKIVDLIKEKAEEFDHQVMMIDSPAGTGCPVIAALNGTDLVVLISEPTPSGLADLKRVLTVVNHFQTPYRVVINKWDINPQMTEKIKKEFKDNFLGKISYDKKIFQAIAELKPILKTDLKAKKEILTIFHQLNKNND